MDLIQEINSGLESLGLAEAAAEDADFQERLLILQDRMQAIEETGLVSRDQVQQLVASGVEINERRYPIASFTIEPSPVGVRPALEAADSERKSMFIKMLNAAVELFRKIKAWILAQFSKLMALIKSKVGVDAAKNAENAPKALPVLDSMILDTERHMRTLAAEARAKGSLGVKVVEEIQDIWKKFLDRDHQIAANLLSNRFFNSELLTNHQLRVDVRASQQSFATVAVHMLEHMKTANTRLQRIVSGTRTPEQVDSDMVALLQYLEKGTHHPFTTALAQRYGEDHGDEATSVLEGYSALVSYITSSQPVDQDMGGDWMMLSKNIGNIVQDISPSSWINSIGGSEKVFKLDIEAATDPTRLILVLDRSEKARDVIRILTEAQKDMANGLKAVFRIEAGMASVILAIGHAVQDRINAFISVGMQIENQYRKLDLETKWTPVYSKFVQDMDNLVSK